MGCWDIFCLLCGNPYRGGDEGGLTWVLEKGSKSYNGKDVDDLCKKTKWMDNCTFLTVCDTVVHDCQNKSCNIIFGDKKNTYYHLMKAEDIDSVGRHGVFVHTDCWKYVAKKHGISLKYSDLPIPVVKTRKESDMIMRGNKIFEFVDYGIIENYWEQDFAFDRVLEDKNKELCYSPLVSNKTARRIDSVFNKLKIKSGRTGPSISATFYKDNIVKIGNNGCLWIVKGGKWVQLAKVDTHKVVIKKNTKEMKYIESLRCIGEPISYNSGKDKMVFIKSLEETGKNAFTIELIKI